MKTRIVHTIKKFALVLTAAATVVLLGCNDLLIGEAPERTSNSASATGARAFVSFVADDSLARTVIADVDFREYTYTVVGSNTDSGITDETLISKKAYDELSMMVVPGAWSFYVTAYAPSATEPALEATVKATIGSGDNTITVPFTAVVGGTGYANFNLHWENKDIKKIIAGVYDNPLTADSGEELTMSADGDSATYRARVNSGVTQYVRFFLYDTHGNLVSRHTEGVYAIAGVDVGKTIDVEIELYSFTAVVTLNHDGKPWTNSTATVELKDASGRSYPMQRGEGTAVFTANVPANLTYSVYVDGEKLDAKLSVDNKNATMDLTADLVTVIFHGVEGVAFGDAEGKAVVGAVYVAKGGNYTFTAWVLQGYTGTLTVLQDGSELSGTAENGKTTYTLTKVTSGVVISANPLESTGAFASLDAPSYTQIAAAGVNYGGGTYSMAVIDLGDTKTTAAIAKDAAVATGTVGSKSGLTFKAAENVAAGSTKIPVVVQATGLTGEATLTISNSAVSGVSTVYGDASAIYTIYAGQDFDTVNADDVAYSPYLPPILVDDGANGFALCEDASSAGGYRGAFTVNSNNPTGNPRWELKYDGSYVVEFDLKLDGLANGTSYSYFYLYNSDITYKTSGGKFVGNSNGNTQELTANPPNTCIQAESLVWRLSGDAKWLKSGTMQHYRILVNYSAEVGKSTVTVYVDGEQIDETIVTGKGDVQGVLLEPARTTKQTIDNIAVYTYDGIGSAGAGSSASFKTKTIDLQETLKTYGMTTLVQEDVSTGICFAWTSGTKVTVTPFASGTAMLFLSGTHSLSNGGTEEAAIVLPITVSASGTVSAGEPLVYGTAKSFDKWAEDIAGTDSALGSLDTSEPADSGVPDSVNMTELAATLGYYDSEDDVLPQVKVMYNLGTNKWELYSTSDTFVTEASTYSRSATSYTGLLDAVNAGFGLLSGSKPKIQICNSGSTGTAVQNSSSVVSSSDRMAGHHSIIRRGNGNCIIDFGGNTIWVDTSGEDANKKNIDAFIDFERGATNISVRNLTLTGTPSYGIFMAQASDIVCANIHFGKAKGDKIGPGIGIRPQSEATANGSVTQDRWSHDLYLYNISGNGLGEHVVETFNAYNVYMDKIEGVDIGGNTVLLNCTYDAWIGTIRGVRACAGGGYAAFRCANDVGPNINVHYIYSEACGRGIFFVSTVTGVNIDKVNVLNAYQGILYNSCQYVNIHGGKIQTNGGTLKYYDSSVEENTPVYSIKTKSAKTSDAIEMTNASSSAYMATFNNTVQNVEFVGFDTAVKERNNSCANYNTYKNIKLTGTKNLLVANTTSDNPLAWDVVDGTPKAGDTSVTGSELTADGFKYKLNSAGTAVITGATTTSGALTIPTSLGGKSVTEIADFAFYATGVTSVTIPSSVTVVGDCAFAECKNLTSVTFKGNGDVEVQAAAFRNCTALNELDLTGVKYLRNNAFANCTALYRVDCPKSVTYFGANVFYNCTIDLIIRANKTATMNMETYAFFFMNHKSTIYFDGVTAAPPTNTSLNNKAQDSKTTRYLEKNVYTGGVWATYWYNVAFVPTYNPNGVVSLTSAWTFNDLGDIAIAGVAGDNKITTAEELAVAPTVYTSFAEVDTTDTKPFYIKNDVTYRASSGKLSMTIKSLNANGTPLNFNRYSSTMTKIGSKGNLDVGGDVFVIKNVQGPATVTVKYAANSGSDKTDRYAYVRIDGTEYKDSYGEKNIVPAAGATLTADYVDEGTIGTIVIGCTMFARFYDVQIDYMGEGSNYPVTFIDENGTETGYALTLNTSSSSKGYYFAALDGKVDDISVSGSTLTANESFFFRAPVENGNYKVTLTTSATSVVSECITEPVQYHLKNNAGTVISSGGSGAPNPWTPPTQNNQPMFGITKNITSDTPFEVAVCDGVLDLEFVYDSTAITVSKIVIEKESYSKRAKPYLIAIGDSTTAQGDSTMPNEASNLSKDYISWASCISNDYLESELSASGLGDIVNCAQSGGTVGTIYNDGRIEMLLLNVRPGDYVSINIGINTQKEVTVGGQKMNIGTADTLGPVLSKYVIKAVEDRGGIPFITTITPQGPTSDNDSAVFLSSTTSAVAYSNSYARGSYYGADYDPYASTGKGYYGGKEYAVGTTVPAYTWINSRHTGTYNIVLIELANYHGIPVVDFGVYGERYLNEHYATADGCKTVRSLYYNDNHHYKRAWGEILAKYMLECVKEMQAGTYRYPFTDYQPQFVYIP